MNITTCICGCGDMADHKHHAITRQTIKRACANAEEYRRLCKDPRNILSVHHQCHWDHHQHACKLPITCLPDSVFEFAREVLGAGPAYERLIRDYQGEDPRLDALLADWEQEAAA
jgi:hypothetical protein